MHTIVYCWLNYIPIFVEKNGVGVLDDFSLIATMVKKHSPENGDV